MKVLINAANLHVGGGVQVAASFLFELSDYLLHENQCAEQSYTVVCSTEVYKQLPIGFDESVFDSFSIVNIYGLKQPNKNIKDKFSQFDVCFTVFGPLYFTPKSRIHICGFAQAWIAYKKNLAFKQLPFWEKVKSFLRFESQWYFFRKADQLVVEQSHVKQALITQRGMLENKIDVVDNCISSIYRTPSLWEPLANELPDEEGVISLGFLGRAYTHKNLAILPAVNELLTGKYGLSIRFVFTLTNEEMEGLGFDLLPNFHTIGSISNAQCPSFYQLIDALIFPSLLECFSATPIEAMVMKTPVFASDLPFVRGVCEDTIFYFDPLDADSIAQVVAANISTPSSLLEQVEKGYLKVLNMPTATERSHKYIELITLHSSEK